MEDKVLEISRLELNRFDTDYRPEAVVANIIKYYHQYANIFFKRVGANHRPYRKDLRNLYETTYGLDEETLVVESYREGFYDYLPEGLFHPPDNDGFERGAATMIQKIQEQKTAEKNIRAFFQPFEQEFFYTQIAALIKETEFDIQDKSGALVQVVSEFWPFLKKVKAHDAKVLLYILPLIHQVRAKKAWIEQFLSAFLRIPVKIDYVPNVIKMNRENADDVRLGDALLGISLIPSGDHGDGLRNWQVNIGPIPHQEIYKFIPGHPFRELLRKIYDYLAPLNVDVYERCITKNEAGAFILGDHNNHSRLGYSTFIPDAKLKTAAEAVI